MCGKKNRKERQAKKTTRVTTVEYEKNCLTALKKRVPIYTEYILCLYIYYKVY